MTGNNSMNLNAATMIKAVEFYLREEVFKDVKFSVLSVKETGPRKAGMVGDGFTVELKCEGPAKL